MPGQLVVVRNFKAKIANYATLLGLSPAQVTAADALCDAFIGSVEAVEQWRQTMVAATRWRDDVLNGTPEGQPAPPAPVFPVVGATNYTNGVVTAFFRLRDQILLAPGYTIQIGEDLGLVGTEIMPIPPDAVTPTLKPVTSAGYWVNLNGSMQGMDALRVEYSSDGAQFTTVAFLTKTPGGFQITPKQANQPESGVLRGVFIKKNVEYGNYSANYPITIS